MNAVPYRLGKWRADRELRRIVRPLWGRSTPHGRDAILRRLVAEGAVDVTDLLTASAVSELISRGTPGDTTREGTK